MNTKTKISFGVLTIMVLSLAVVSSSLAATYQYVDKSGRVQTVEGMTPTQIYARSDIDSNSGVMQVTSSNSATVTTYPTQTTYTTTYPAYTPSTVCSNTSSNSAMTYQYVDKSGQVQTIQGQTPTQIYARSDIDSNSGIMRVCYN